MAFRLAACVLLLVSPVAAKTVKYKFVIESSFVAPDGCDRKGIIVNAAFPGPEIRVRQGDELEVTVENMMHTEVTALHWHGVYPIDPWMEGSNGVTQCGITRGSFTYKFTVRAPPGTYWWHGHAGSQRIDGLYGAFIVEANRQSRPKSNSELMVRRTDGEFTVMLNDWFHDESAVQMQRLHSKPFRFWGNPSTILFNGKAKPREGFYSSPAAAGCVRVDATGPLTTPQHEVFEVQAGKSYFFRVINVGSVHYQVLKFQHHDMTIVEIDGAFVRPSKVPHLDINVGQRIGVVVRAHSTSGNYWVKAETRFGAPISGAAVLSVTSPTAKPGDAQALDAPLFNIPMEAGFDPSSLRAVNPLPADMHTATKMITVAGIQTIGEGGLVTLNTGHGAWSPPADGTPLLNYVYSGKLEELKGTGAYPAEILKKGEVVDVLFENHAILPQIAESHPMHIHGHNFYLLAMGSGKFDMERDYPNINLRYPVRWDVATVFPNLQLTDIIPIIPPLEPVTPINIADAHYGWTLVRFRADNPGAWLIHCHIAPHFALGMAVPFVVAPELIPAPSSDMPQCGRMQAWAA